MLHKEVSDLIERVEHYASIANWQILVMSSDGSVMRSLAHCVKMLFKEIPSVSKNASLFRLLKEALTVPFQSCSKEDQIEEMMDKIKLEAALYGASKERFAIISLIKAREAKIAEGGE